MDKTSKPSLANIVNTWIATIPVLRDHIEVTGVQNGFFVDMKCARKHDPGADQLLSIAYIGKVPRDTIIGPNETYDNSPGEWLHGLNPYNKNFFRKLKKYMIECHDRVHQDLGCKNKIRPH